ncbi:MAG: hypothetical protein HOF62_02840 [Gammaproteobacteria bacterium]|jgi:hypothetical protein|nr:hypothetical protein [Gammaproteobacteria bacterium]
MRRITYSISIISVLILISSFLILNKTRYDDPYFWLLLGWLSFLIIINYIATFAVFTSFGKHSSKQVGGLPAISLSIFFGSIISAYFALQNYYLFSQYELLVDFNLVFQIITVGLTTVLVLLIILTSKFAETGARHLLDRNELSKKISNLLDISGDHFDSEIKEMINNINEFVKYKMPHPATVDEKSYLEICKNVEDLNEASNHSLDEVKETIRQLSLNLKLL